MAVTHLHHLLYVFLDECRVSIGLHRYSPLIDHAGLGFGCRSRGGVLLHDKKPNQGNFSTNKSLQQTCLTGPMKYWWQHWWKSTSWNICFSTVLLFLIYRIAWTRSRTLVLNGSLEVVLQYLYEVLVLVLTGPLQKLVAVFIVFCFVFFLGHSMVNLL